MAKQIALYSALAAAGFGASLLVMTSLEMSAWGRMGLTGLSTYGSALLISGLVVLFLIRPRVRGASVAVVLLGVALLGLTVTCVATSSRWVGTTFPGFFVMPNHVVPAAGLPTWTGMAFEGVYHHAILEVNGSPISTAEEVYERVRAESPGASFEYLLAAAGEEPHRATIPTMVFGLGDYFWLFVPYILTGVLFAAAGLVVWMLKPHTPESLAMLVLGNCLGLFALTGTDLYGPYWFYRLHLNAEAFLPATLVHLALVFPNNYLNGRRRLVLALPYGVALNLALAHQWFHFEPAMYSFIYRLCGIYLGVAGLALIVSVGIAYWTTTSQLVRQRVRVLLVGTLATAGPAVVLMGASGLSGGKVPVNAAAFTSFVFPLTLAYAIVKHDLFAIDAMVKRAAYYLALTGTVFIVYVILVSLLDMTLRYEGLVGSVGSAFVLSLAIVVLFEPIKQQVRMVVDTICFRRVYDPEKVLQATVQSLATSPHLGRVLQILLQTIRRELQVTHAEVYLCGQKGTLVLAWNSGQAERAVPRSIDSNDPVAMAVAKHPRPLSPYDIAESEAGSQGSEPDLFSLLGADLFIPLRFRGEFVGLFSLGPKESGRFYTAADVRFLSTLAAQSVVSILHAMAYRQVEELNRDLERKVAQRTEDLANANTELSISLEERQQAYDELKRKQEQLVQSERMAALGRLTAGIAHEISTPLGAALSSLQIVEDLAREYRSAIDEPSTEVDDHREMAQELAEVSSEAREWTEKAARFVRSIKIQGIGGGDVHEVDFRLADVINETCQLVAHRVRLCECTLKASVDPSTPVLFGDPGRLGQVIANLLTNAVDAYRDFGKGGGEVRISAGPGPDGVEVRVSDEAGGIAPDHLPRIFEELFTTKPRGLGTGLGLPISRSIMSDCFGGTIDVDSEQGRGTTFTVRLPQECVRKDAEARAAESRGEATEPRAEAVGL